MKQNERKQKKKCFKDYYIPNNHNKDILDDIIKDYEEYEFIVFETE